MWTETILSICIYSEAQPFVIRKSSEAQSTVIRKNPWISFMQTVAHVTDDMYMTSPNEVKIAKLN